MEEYVAKSVLKKELNISNLHSGIISALQNIVDEIPVADVQEVRHGKWREGRFGNGMTVPVSKYYICDQCNHTSQKKTHYCAHCGAKMDGKENEK